jgi:hypothetical protein
MSSNDPFSYFDTSMPTFTEFTDMGFLLPTLRDAGFEPRQLSGMKDDNRRDDPRFFTVFGLPRARRSITPVETLSDLPAFNILGTGRAKISRWARLWICGHQRRGPHIHNPTNPLIFLKREHTRAFIFPMDAASWELRRISGSTTFRKRIPESPHDLLSRMQRSHVKESIPHVSHL